ncbi:MAG: TolC family protein [Capnocytophaga sp.]|nr:TolC family protein [Capnocytophaga sp.]
MKTLVKIFFLFLGINTINAQTPISFENALEKALENNLEIKGANLKLNYQEKMKKSGAMIDPLSLAGEFGQFNSKDVDNRFTVSQTFRLPGFYKKQKQVLIEEWKASQIGLNLQKWQLKKQLSLIFNQLHYFDAKEKLLTKVDSIYGKYLERANVRLQKGESNILEKTSAESLKNQANIQLNNLKKDREIALQQLGILINDGTIYTNEAKKFTKLNLSFDLQNIDNHTIIQQLEQQKNVEDKRLLAEKSKLSPSFSVGYNNMSMLRDYGSSRLHGGLVGINIPIFNAGQKAVIAGQEINQKIAENNKEMALLTLKKQGQDLYKTYEKLKTEVEYYENEGLANSEKIIKTANRQFYGGEINFLEWTMVMNQALDIQNQHINQLNELNSVIIELNSLSESE